MQRALFPIILASFGLIIFMWAFSMPLFEWEVSKAKSNFPEKYEVYVEPSPWTSKVGDSLDSSYYVSRKVRISIGQNTCLNNELLKVNIERSARDRSIESVVVNFNQGSSWLISSFWGVLILSGIYFYWLTIWQAQRPISTILIPVSVVIIIFCLPMGLLRLLNPVLAIDYFGPVSTECSGTLLLNAQISRFHYATPIMLGLGVLGEIGAIGIMLRQVIMTIIHGKESARSAVG